MDGRGRALDNVFVERLWRTLKYEEIYLRGYDSPTALERGARQLHQLIQQGAATHRA